MRAPYLIKNSSGMYWVKGSNEFADGVGSPENALEFDLGMEPIRVFAEIDKAIEADPTATILNMDIAAKCIEPGCAYYDMRYQTIATVIYSTSSCLWARLASNRDIEFMSYDAWKYNQRAGQYSLM